MPTSTNINPLQPTSTYFNPPQKKYQLQPNSTHLNLLHPFTHPIYLRKEQSLSQVEIEEPGTFSKQHFWQTVLEPGLDQFECSRLFAGQMNSKTCDSTWKS